MHSQKRKKRSPSPSGRPRKRQPYVQWAPPLDLVLEHAIRRYQLFSGPRPDRIYRWVQIKHAVAAAHKHGHVTVRKCQQRHYLLTKFMASQAKESELYQLLLAEQSARARREQDEPRESEYEYEYEIDEDAATNDDGYEDETGDDDGESPVTPVPGARHKASGKRRAARQPVFTDDGDEIEESEARDMARRHVSAPMGSGVSAEHGCGAHHDCTWWSTWFRVVNRALQVVNDMDPLPRRIRWQSIKELVQDGQAGPNDVEEMLKSAIRMYTKYEEARDQKASLHAFWYMDPENHTLVQRGETSPTPHVFARQAQEFKRLVRAVREAFKRRDTDALESSFLKLREDIALLGAKLRGISSWSEVAEAVRVETNGLVRLSVKACERRLVQLLKTPCNDSEADVNNTDDPTYWCLDVEKERLLYQCARKFNVHLVRKKHKASAKQQAASAEQDEGHGGDGYQSHEHDPMESGGADEGAGTDSREPAVDDRIDEEREDSLVDMIEPGAAASPVSLSEQSAQPPQASSPLVCSTDQEVTASQEHLEEEVNRLRRVVDDMQQHFTAAAANVQLSADAVRTENVALREANAVMTATVDDVRRELASVRHDHTAAVEQIRQDSATRTEQQETLLKQVQSELATMSRVIQDQQTEMIALDAEYRRQLATLREANTTTLEQTSRTLTTAIENVQTTSHRSIETLRQNQALLIQEVREESQRNVSTVREEAVSSLDQVRQDQERSRLAMEETTTLLRGLQQEQHQTAATIRREVEDCVTSLESNVSHELDQITVAATTSREQAAAAAKTFREEHTTLRSRLTTLENDLKSALMSHATSSARLGAVENSVQALYNGSFAQLNQAVQLQTQLFEYQQSKFNP